MFIILEKSSLPRLKLEKKIIYSPQKQSSRLSIDEKVSNVPNSVKNACHTFCFRKLLTRVGLS